MGPFFFGMVAFTIILVAGLLFKMADLVIQRGVSLGIVIRLFCTISRDLWPLPYQ